MVCWPRSYYSGPNNISHHKSSAAKWLLYCYGARSRSSEPLKLYQQTHEKHKYKLFQWKYFLTQQLFIEFLSWRPMKALRLWVARASLTNQSLIESRLYEYFVRDIIVNKTFLFIRALNWIEWRRLVIMMADLRDWGSLVMNGLSWAQSISRVESENAIPQLEMIHSGKPRSLECQPLQSSHITSRNISCMNELQRFYEWLSLIRHIIWLFRNQQTLSHSISVSL